MKTNTLKQPKYLKTLFLLLLIGLSACDPLPKPKKGSTRDMLVKYDKPIAFKKRTLGYIQRPQELGKYVCQALENQLADRFLVHKEYSAAFIFKILGELPPTLQNTYATCYVESELKEESLSDYFSINQAFLGTQALAGYKSFGALPQIKLLSRALALGARKPKNAQEQQQLKLELAKLSNLWVRQNFKELQALRGAYSKIQLDGGKWPIKENS